MKVLVTGGLGFIGSHLVDMLAGKGHDVRVLDSLEFQVHQGKFPGYANPSAEYMIGNVSDRESVKRALADIEIVFHEAAAVGVGQSMYQVAKYINANAGGTGMLLDELVNGNYPVKKFIVAASNTIYGEGLYECDACGHVEPPIRAIEQIKQKDWHVRCPSCGSVVHPVPTPETKTLASTNVYSLTKKYQEELAMSIGETYGMPVVGLRYFNVYGPRQSLSNPYTGVASIFISRVKNGNAPFIYEDGLQSRDFINVKDVAGVNCFVMEHAAANFQRINVGTQNPTSILDLAKNIIDKMGKGRELVPAVPGDGRPGDIRHCFADISKLKAMGYVHQHPLIDLDVLLEWSRDIEAVDRFDSAKREFEDKLRL